LEHGSVQEAKAMKDKRAAGVALFSKRPLKAVRLLQKSLVVGPSAEEVAQWLRVHLHILDRDAVGELFGLPDPEAVAIMHEYINQV
jgi:Sec7-like guanine-nucleotide exchange factor